MSFSITACGHCAGCKANAEMDKAIAEFDARVQPEREAAERQYALVVDRDRCRTVPSSVLRDAYRPCLILQQTRAEFVEDALKTHGYPVCSRMVITGDL